MGPGDISHGSAGAIGECGQVGLGAKNQIDQCRIGFRIGGRTIGQHQAGFDAATVETRASRGGNYLGITITVTATSRAQLDELYRTLSTHPMVKVVL